MKYHLLTTLLRKLTPESDSVLIFTRTRATANELADHLNEEGMQVGILHSERSQRARQETLDQFRTGRLPYLVATDVAARGIDVSSISHVINFDTPACADDYLHRIGRTGRMERTGYAITLATKKDARVLHEIERMLGSKIEVERMEGLDDPQMNMTDDTMQEHKSRAKRHAAVPHHTATASMKNQGANGRTRRAQQEDAPMTRTDRPEREQRATTAPSERRKPSRAEATPAFPQAKERPAKRRSVDSSAHTEQRGKRKSTTKPTETLTRAERRRLQFGDPTKVRARPSDHRYAEAPRRTEKRHPQPDNTTLTRAERRRMQFGEPTKEQAQSTDRTRQRRFAQEAAASSKQRERTAKRSDGIEATHETRRPGRKSFEGMAAVSKHRRKYAAGKRQPGEVGGRRRS